MYCSNCGSNISEKAEVCPKCGIRPFTEKNYCFNCGIDVKSKQEICVDCGVSLNRKPQNSSSSSAKEPWLIALLSFLITGLGQMIIGQVKKGAVILLASAILSFITMGISALVTIPIAIIDGYLVAKKIKDGKQVGEWEFF